MSSTSVSSTPRRHLSERQADTVARLAEATAEEIRHTGFDGLTVRNVARRAGVAPATAYTYFASKEHLVTEVYWRRVQALPRQSPDRRLGPARRVTQVLDPLALLVADEPALAAACTVALLSPDPEVRRLRDEIGLHTVGLLREAVGDTATPAQLLTLEAAFSGLLLRAGIGHASYSELPALMGEVAAVTFGQPSGGNQR